MFDKEYTNKLDNLIKEKFPIIYDYKFNGIVLLYGGALRNTFINFSINDLDFIVLTQNPLEIINFIKKFNLSYRKNSLGIYKIKYNNFMIDMFATNDLLDSVLYDTDMLFYDVKRHGFISCGSIDAIKNNTITTINKDKQPLYIDKKRIKKIKHFVKCITKKKRVKVKENKILWRFRLFRNRLIKYSKKIIISNFYKCFNLFSNKIKEYFKLLFLNLLDTYIYILICMVLFSIFIGKYNILNGLLLLLFLKAFQIICKDKSDSLNIKFNKQMKFNINKKISLYSLNFNNNKEVINKFKLSSLNILKKYNIIINYFWSLVSVLIIILYICFLNKIAGIILFIGLFIIIILSILPLLFKLYIYEKNNDFYYEKSKYSSVVMKISKYDNFNTNDECNNYDKFINMFLYILIFIIFMLCMFFSFNSRFFILILIILLMYNSPVIIFCRDLISLRDELNMFNDSCNHVFSLLEKDIYLSEIYGNEYKNKCDGNIEFKNVNFKYDNKYILNNISFKVSNNEVFVINKNERVILDLITRLYYVDSGEVLIDGLSLNNYDYKFIRENISVINQNPYLFNMSIKDNFRLIKEDITDEEIYKVCKLVYLDKCIDELPNKYDTIIGNGGKELNDFENQRLSLARAIVKNTKIMLIDEIGYKEKDNYDLIMKIINKIKKNYTIIMVSDNK